MKKYLILSLVVLVSLLGFAGKSFAITPDPTITSVTGNTVNFINLAGSTTVAVAGTLTGSSTASTTIFAIFVVSGNTATSTGSQTVGNTNSYSFNVDASALPEGSVVVGVEAKTVGLATSTGVVTATVTKDVTKPTLSNVLMSTNNSSTTIAKAADIVTLFASSSETIASPTVVLLGRSGGNVTVTNPASNGWRATTTMASTDTAGIKTFSIAFTDLAGNAGTAVTAVSAGVISTFYALPVITLNGYNPYKCNKGWVCADASASAVDSVGKTVTLSTLGTVNANVVGTYGLDYGGVDDAGNAATSSRLIYIVAPSRAATPSTSAAATTDVGTTSETTTTETVQTPETPVVTPVVEAPAPVTVIKVSGIANAINRQLKNGVSNAGVKLLQLLLAKDSSIYPEGLATGYYGNLTQKAVQRFQEKYGVAKKGTPGYGEVGPRTKAKLIEIYGN